MPARSSTLMRWSSSDVGVAQDRACQRRRAPQLLDVPGSEQAEGNGIAPAPSPLIFAVIVIGERIAGEPLDLVGSKVAVEAIEQDLPFVCERLGVAARIGAIDGEVLAAPPSSP